MSSNSSADRTAARAKYDFAGQVAIVTGASNGIGAEIAQHLRASGATVVNRDLQPAASGPAAELFCQVDVTQPVTIAAALAQVQERFGRVHMLVNSAGFAGPTLPLIDYDPAMWQRIVDVNLIGVFHVCQAVAATMRASGYGRIVNIASLAGKEGTPNASAYSAAKAGVLALTKALGKELAKTDVLVNAIAPAAIKTALLEQMAPEHVQTMVSKSPMARLGEVQEVAELVSWLCSPSCSFSTGAVFDLSGGRATY